MLMFASGASAQTGTLRIEVLADEAELAATPGVLRVGGGLPIEVAGQFYGAIGASGVPRRQTAGERTRPAPARGWRRCRP
ncbi:heme-binding protein [Ectothiorhodospiraceae bacterium 2226]|nr:heme-binding protein [Ectothiorhodospiraceae bacterium 2226]